MKMKWRSVVTCLLAVLLLCALGITAAAAKVESDPEGFVKGNVTKKGVDVAAVFLGIEKQPVKDDDGETDKEDTIWIYYTDNTFEQYALIDDKTELFSIGTYEFTDGGDFILDSKDNGKITINRTKKFERGKGLVEHVSSHTYDLGTLGFTQLYGPDAEHKVVTIFSGPEKQPFKETHDDDKENEKIDTWWVYYDDGCFEQFAEVHDKPEMFSKGTYELSNNGDFVYEKDEKDHGTVTIIRTHKYVDGKGLADHDSSHTYDLGTLGFDQLFVIAPAEK